LYYIYISSSNRSRS